MQRLRDGERLIANFSGVHEPKNDPPHGVVLEMGGPAAVPVDLAQIQAGTRGGGEATTGGQAPALTRHTPAGRLAPFRGA